MRTVIKGLLMAAVCLMIMVNIASAEMPDPAMEAEQYLAGEDWQAVRESIPPQAAEKMAEQGISSFSELIAMPDEDAKAFLRLALTSEPAQEFLKKRAESGNAE